MWIVQPASDHLTSKLDSISESLPEPHQTRTRVILQALQPQAGGRPPQGTAACDARGLGSPGGFDGAPAGRYRPTIWAAGQGSSEYLPGYSDAAPPADKTPIGTC